MVSPEDVPHILSDAARLLGTGELVVFGSAALSFWLDHPPSSRDVDVWCEPAERGDVIQAVMGELSWYHNRHGAYLEVWGPETFAAPTSWRSRAKSLEHPDAPGVTLVVAHPHDILLSKLERLESHDLDHIRRILREFPSNRAHLMRLAEEVPYRDGSVEAERVARFEHNLQRILDSLPA